MKRDRLANTAGGLRGLANRNTVLRRRRLPLRRRHGLRLKSAELYEILEAEGFTYAIRLLANN